MITFIHISDTHVRSDGMLFHDRDPLRHLRRLVVQVNAFPQRPDFVVHTGDIADDRGAEAYSRAQAVLGDLAAPLVIVNGNHDDRILLRKYFDAPLADSGDPGAPLDYAFEVRGERFLVLDAHTNAVPDPLGLLSADQLARVRAEATPGGPPLTVFLHYPPFAMGSPWLDANMILTNGAELHAALLPARERLRGVFFGHLHRSCQITRGGITYTGAPSLSAGYAWRPWDTRPERDPAFPAAYNVVQYQGAQVIVHQYALPSGD